MSGKARIKEWLTTWTGINPGAILARIPTPLRIYSFWKDLKRFKSQYKEGDEVFPITKLYPLFFDKENSAGSAYGGYFWQDLYVAQRIFKNNPRRHVDVGSRIDGFVAHVATFRSIEVIDVRPLKSIIPNVRFTQLDITNCNKEEITDSISCLHAMEHFGLGRYGDTICYNGHVIGLRNITRMLKSRGRLYLSVPIGVQRIEFHAHRIFSLSYLLRMCSEYYEIEHFSCFDDHGGFHTNVLLTDEIIQSNCGCEKNGIGILELIKKIDPGCIYILLCLT